MKILHVINNLASGGAEKLLTDLLPMLKAEGHEVDIAISNARMNVPAYEKSMQANGIQVINLNKGFKNPLLVLELIKVIKKGKYDIVHAHLFPSQYWLAFASFFIPKKTKLVKTEHSVFNKRHNHPILKPLEKLVYNRYSVVICITELVKRSLEKFINLQHLVVINNGVDLSKIESAREVANDTSVDFLNADCYNILMTGRFDGVIKDQNTLIKAASLLDKNVHVYFAGVGPGEMVSKEFAKSTGMENNAHFLGMRTDVYVLMAAMDLNVLSTNHEGLSGVTLESMASGRPFLGSSVGGVMDIVPDDSFLFPPKNPEALAERIKAVIQDAELRDQLVSKASMHVQQYDITYMVQQILDLYKKVLTPKRA